jgi:uncharacterized protein YndB with AHSA1/START domain
MAITRHIFQIYLQATPEEVWQAITDPEWVERVFGTLKFSTTVEVSESPRRLVQTWQVLSDAAASVEQPSRVEWQISEAADGLTRLRLEHGDLAFSPITWALANEDWPWTLSNLKSLLETGTSLPVRTDVAMPQVSDVEGQWHRAQAIICNNTTKEVLNADRTSDNNEEMLRRAYAAAYHWQRASRRIPANEARAYWMLSKVHLASGHPELALAYADGCLKQCEQHGIEDWDLAYAHDARARALHHLGRAREADEALAKARSVEILDPEDLAIVLESFAEPF